MLIQLRVDERLKGAKAAPAGPAVSTVLEALRQSEADPARLRVVCDWLQYRQNFREPVQVRPLLPSAMDAARLESSGQPSYELAIDLRRSGSLDLHAAVDRALRGVSGPPCPDDRCYLEDWQPGSSSCIWAFNALYWKALGLWEQATGREYEQALPGGQTDARNTAAACEQIGRLFGIWDGLASRRALPAELHVLELGVGNGNQARVWLDEFQTLDRERGRDYYQRLHYLMGDYS
ncbi:MAG: hypothetical protein JO023_06420, partial [Chloroflexi bacterium]|nr:hypothetical protein [Chloroflexota bacterium]